MNILHRCGGILIGLSLIFNTCPQAMLIKLNTKSEKSSLVVDKNIKEEKSYLNIDVKIPQIEGLDNKISEKVINRKILDFTNLWIKDVKEIADEYYGEPKNISPIFPYQLISNYIIKRENKILSFYIDYYQFSGGAHGATTKMPYNIDIITGKELLLKDLFIDGYDYEKVINKEIKKQIDKNSEFYFTGKDGFNGIKENQQYFIDEENVIVYFGEYEIAPYVTGIPEFKIPISIFKNNFKYIK